MIKLKDILKENAPGFTGRKFGDPLPTMKSVMEKHQQVEASPLSPRHKFDRPTVIHISNDEMEILHKQGRLETDGVTIIFGE